MAGSVVRWRKVPWEAELLINIARSRQGTELARLSLAAFSSGFQGQGPCISLFRSTNTTADRPALSTRPAPTSPTCDQAEAPRPELASKRRKHSCPHAGRARCPGSPRSRITTRRPRAGRRPHGSAARRRTAPASPSLAARAAAESRRTTPGLRQRANS